jgi:hypothetical protein
MFLVDTNVWLERLLDQARSEEVGRFLNVLPTDRLFITDFALHSVAIVMSTLNKMDAFVQFVQDAFVDGALSVVRLEPEEMQRIGFLKDKFDLDFDDAFQYAAAEKYGLTLVSLDADFDRTERGRKTPAQILQAQ